MSEINNLPDVIKSLKEYKAKRSAAKSAWNKHKRLVKKYEFLNVLVKAKQYKGDSTTARKEDDDLEIAVKDCLNSIGIHSIRPIDKADFDVKSRFDGYKWGIEVKNGNLPGENEMFQAHKYAMRINREMEPLVVWNNAYENQQFNPNHIKDAEINKYGIITTKELVNGYMKLKKGKISFQEFTTELKKHGLIKYSLKAMGKVHKDKPKNSDAD